MQTIETAIRTGADYIDSLRGRNLTVYLFGERIDNIVDHPMIRPSINAVARTFDLALEDPDLEPRLYRRLWVNGSTGFCTSRSRRRMLCGRTTCSVGWDN